MRQKKKKRQIEKKTNGKHKPVTTEVGILDYLKLCCGSWSSFGELKNHREEQPNIHAIIEIRWVVFRELEQRDEKKVRLLQHKAVSFGKYCGKGRHCVCPANLIKNKIRME